MKFDAILIMELKKTALISSIVSKSNNKALFVFDEEKLDEKNISDLLKFTEFRKYLISM